MKIYDARYERTFKVADYESEKFSLASAVDEGEDVGAVFQGMKDIVNASFSGKAVSTSKSTTTTMARASTAADTKTTSATTTAKTDAKTETKADTTAKAEASTKTEAKADKATTTKAKAPAITKYTRENEKHREDLGTLIDKLIPGWRDGEADRKEDCKLASKNLEGVDFKDDKGVILESFKEELRKKLAKWLPESSDL